MDKICHLNGNTSICSKLHLFCTLTPHCGPSPTPRSTLFNLKAATEFPAKHAKQAKRKAQMRTGEGCLSLDAAGKPVCPYPASPGFPNLTRHFGTVKGAWPRVVESSI